MQPFPRSIRRARAFLPALAPLLICGSLVVRVRADEPPSDLVGFIDGEAVSASGPINVEVVRGLKKTMLRSGSDVRVRSGTARINLVEGGQIVICGPAHLSVLKFGSSLTVALDLGTIHVHLPAQAGSERKPALTVYTAQIQAHPVAIGDGMQDVLVGFDTTGAMCIRADRGAVRLEQQLTGQNILVPQAGDVLVADGQLDGLQTSAGRCVCELPDAIPDPPPQSEIGILATAEEVKKKSESAVPKEPEFSPEKSAAPVVREEPVYKVLMPPLVYDASAKVQPEIDPRTIILVRRVRVRSALVFRGRVEGQALTTAVASSAPVSAPASARTASAPPKPPRENVSFFDRVLTFFRKLWS